jgi:hypothetical protein
MNWVLLVICLPLLVLTYAIALVGLLSIFTKVFLWGLQPMDWFLTAFIRRRKP